MVKVILVKYLIEKRWIFFSKIKSLFFPSSVPFPITICAPWALQLPLHMPNSTHFPHGGHSAVSVNVHAREPRPCCTPPRGFWWTQGQVLRRLSSSFVRWTHRMSCHNSVPSSYTWHLSPIELLYVFKYTLIVLRFGFLPEVLSFVHLPGRCLLSSGIIGGSLTGSSVSLEVGCPSHVLTVAHSFLSHCHLLFSRPV